MKVLIFGAHGMLGQELCKRFKTEFEVVAATRHGCDLRYPATIAPYIEAHKPDIVINSAAMININLCETAKEQAYEVNAFAVAKMAEACNSISAKLVQISTDHYYVNGKNRKHAETEPVTLLNNYAHTKFSGEEFATLAKNFLIVRTNIIGFRTNSAQQGFLEWALDGIENNRQLKLFSDYFTSSIDIYNFALLLKMMVKMDLQGLYNVASSEVSSKARFVELLAEDLGATLNFPQYVSIESAAPELVPRATSLGLDVNKIEQALGLLMPSTKQVISKIKEVYNELKLSI